MSTTGLPLEDFYAATEYLTGLSYSALSTIANASPDPGAALTELEAVIDALLAALPALTAMLHSPTSPISNTLAANAREAVLAAEPRVHSEWPTGSRMAAFREHTQLLMDLTPEGTEQLCVGPTTDLDRCQVMAALQAASARLKVLDGKIKGVGWKLTPEENAAFLKQRGYRR